MLSLYEIAKLRTRQQLIDIVGEGGGGGCQAATFFLCCFKAETQFITMTPKQFVLHYVIGKYRMNPISFFLGGVGCRRES